MRNIFVSNETQIHQCGKLSLEIFRLRYLSLALLRSLYFYKEVTVLLLRNVNRPSHHCRLPLTEGMQRKTTILRRLLQ